MCLTNCSGSQKTDAGGRQFLKQPHLRHESGPSNPKHPFLNGCRRLFSPAGGRATEARGFFGKKPAFFQGRNFTASQRGTTTRPVAGRSSDQSAQAAVCLRVPGSPLERSATGQKTEAASHLLPRISRAKPPSLSRVLSACWSAVKLENPVGLMKIPLAGPGGLAR